MLLQHMILQTGDRRRVVIYPQGGLQVEEYVGVSTKANPAGSWYLADVDTITDSEMAEMLHTAHEMVTKQVADWAEGALPCN